MAGAVIVTYNSAEVIGRCLESCVNTPGLEIVVVDNASTDDTRRRILEFPAVHAIFNDRNRGFAGAVNQGIAALDSPYVLLLNPDAELVSGFETLVHRLEQDPRAGVAAGRLVGTDGHDQTKFHLRRLPTPATLAFEALGLNRLLPWNPVNRHYRPENAEQSVEQPAAAFLLVRRAAWEALGGFDESFHPVWFEDVDFSKRLRDNGWTVAFEATATARHIGGHSASRIAWGQRQRFWYGSLLQYAARHFAASRSLVCLAVLVACLPRTVAALLTRRSLEPVVVYSQVFWLAANCLLGTKTPGLKSGARQHAARGARAAG